MSALTKYTPTIPLSEFIDYLFVTSSPTLSLKEYHEPTHPCLLINGSSVSATSLRSGTIKGVFTQPLKQNVHGTSTGIVGVRFKPYGLFTGFGIAGNRTANKIIPGSLLLSEKQMPDLILNEDRDVLIHHVHEALYVNLKPNPILYEITDMVDALIQADLAKNAQKHLANAFERTSKSFIAVFKKSIGITPLKYLHIHKIEEAKRQIKHNLDCNLTDIGYDLGFYDQAHFNRIFKSHTGLTPSQFKLSQRPG